MKPLRLLGLPLHPLLVHFPVAAWTVATGLALFGWIEPESDLAGLAVKANGFGLLTGMVAMFAGVFELAAAPRDPVVRDAIGRHFLWAGLTWFAFAVMWLLQVKGLPRLSAVAGLAGFLLLAGAGHAGARLVYHYGFPRNSSTS